MRKMFISTFFVLVSSISVAAPGTLPAEQVIKGDPMAGKAKSVVCSACHGVDGNSKIPTYPSLAGQHASYTYKQLMQFKNGERPNAIMRGFAAALTDEDMRNLAAYYESQTPVYTRTADPNMVALGEKLYRQGNQSLGVPACMACHGPDGAGNPEAKFPKLRGQYAEYTLSQLRNFHAQERYNDNGRMMRGVAIRLTAEEMDALAQYIQGLR
jgi:cytochrome c553